ncbi:growth arrest and DNA damage-inducible protein GADD45 gamma-like [Haliotis asinina]|uniref:growth arrest and DNA damage-inducible protein GADD45 gamma-like n=1 Tax=Haliotis asinina TaxID=109174 RepID=UPI003531FB18
MTWTVFRDMDTCSSNKKLVDIGDALCKALVQAHRTNRVTSGVMECAKLLRCNPDNVMLCVLPEANGQHDVTLDIQHTLIEAFCWENDIPLIKVDSEEKLAKTLSNEDANNNGDIVRCHSTDVSCLLIEFAKGATSPEDVLLTDYVADVINNDVYPKPVIELPV